ncbi:acyl carrier protein [Saccharopolyspora elongata]|uniref:Acyl carrier protein n=1 Tax=Saccharopolyspora elongata TaxID=2530387 RepID=A0A4V2YMN9_9PSEU|nr:phosphopantetheine-binding protein [Saccharopolyspora elongata]TDD50927.1 acyl carrier protein [Saccharopolyspora elongata]
MTTDQSVEQGSRAAIERELLSFLEQRLRTSVAPDRDLFAEGLITSLFAMELVVQLEQTFDVSIVGPDLKMDSFRSVNAMADLVHRLQRAAPTDGA